MENFAKSPERPENKQHETAMSKFWGDIEKTAEGYRKQTSEDKIEVWWQDLQKKNDLNAVSAGSIEKDSTEKSADTSEKPEIKGGSYSDIRGDMKERGDSGQDYEVHHMPADKVTDIAYNDGPAIKMEKADHLQTASWGKSKEAQEYRDTQKELIEQGKFREAGKMDIDDIRDKFGDKYDDAITEYEAYLDKLESEGKI